MYVQLYQPLAPPMHLQPWMRGVLPGFQTTIVAGFVGVEHGSWSQILIKPKGQGVELVTGMPIGPRLLMTLFFFAGILPGIVFAIIYYVALGSKLDVMRGQIAAALTGQAIPPGPGLPGTGGGGAAAMPGMPGMPGAPMAPPRPTSSINPLAPIWMIVMMVFLFGASGTAGALAYDEGWDKIDRRLEQVESIDADIARHKERYKRAKKGKKPPKGCPPEPNTYSYEPTTCHGCLQYRTKPTLVDPGQKVFRRKKDKDWLVCPSAETLKFDLDNSKGAAEYAESGLEEVQMVAMVGTAGAGGLFVGFLAFLVIWIRKNKVNRKRRKEELAAQGA